MKVDPLRTHRSIEWRLSQKPYLFCSLGFFVEGQADIFLMGGYVTKQHDVIDQGHGMLYEAFLRHLCSGFLRISDDTLGFHWMKLIPAASTAVRLWRNGNGLLQHTSKSAIIPHEMYMRNQPACFPFRDHTLEVFNQELAYSLANDPRANMETCVQWKKDMGISLQ